MRTLKIALATLALLAVGACSDDGGDGTSTDISDEGRPYVDALAAELGDDAAELRLEDGQAECIAATWVNTITPERLEEAGLEPGDIEGIGPTGGLEQLDLSPDDAESMIDGFGACDVDLRQAFFTSLEGDGETSEEEITCLEGAIDDAALKEFFVSSITLDDDPDTADLTDTEFVRAVEDCVEGPGA